MKRFWFIASLLIVSRAFAAEVVLTPAEIDEIAAQVPAGAPGPAGPAGADGTTISESGGVCSADVGGLILEWPCSAAGSTPAPDPDPQPDHDPVPPPPDVEPTPVADSALLDSLLNFAETASRNWNYGGHNVDGRFTADYGLWDYSDSTFEPWLFDRADAFMILYRLTGEQRWRDQAESDAAWYEARIDTAGIFTPKGSGDTKYSYIHTWRSSDTAVRVYGAWVSDFSTSYSAAQPFWTEREVGLALMAAINYYVISGDPAAAQRANALIEQWNVVRNGNQAPLHTLAQHGEEFGNAYATMQMSSPWMSALYFQAARKQLGIIGNRAVLEQVSSYFDWMDANAFVDGSVVHPELTGIILPYYLAGDGIFYDRETPSWGDLDHALDVAGLIQFAIQAKTEIGLPTDRAELRLVQMKETAARAFEHWTRTTDYLPMYRISPPRKFNWWARGIFELLN